MILFIIMVSIVIIAYLIIPNNKYSPKKINRFIYKNKERENKEKIDKFEVDKKYMPKSMKLQLLFIKDFPEQYKFILKKNFYMNLHID